MFGGIFSILFTVHRRHNMHSYSFTSVCDFFFSSMYQCKIKNENTYIYLCLDAFSMCEYFENFDYYAGILSDDMCRMEVQCDC